MKELQGLGSASVADPTEADAKLKESQGKVGELEAKKALVDQVSEWVDTRVIAD